MRSGLRRSHCQIWLPSLVIHRRFPLITLLHNTLHVPASLRALTNRALFLRCSRALLLRFFSSGSLGLGLGFQKHGNLQKYLSTLLLLHFILQTLLGHSTLIFLRRQNPASPLLHSCITVSHWNPQRVVWAPAFGAKHVYTCTLSAPAIKPDQLSSHMQLSTTCNLMYLTARRCQHSLGSRRSTNRFQAQELQVIPSRSRAMRATPHLTQPPSTATTAPLMSSRDVLQLEKNSSVRDVTWVIGDAQPERRYELWRS